MYLVNVLNHKTTATSGPAVVAFGVDLHNECKIFINKVRNKLTGVGVRSTDPEFVSWGCRNMSSSLIGDQFDSLFRRTTQINLGRRLTATLVR